jgi:hypothetical protein
MHSWIAPGPFINLDRAIWPRCFLWGRRRTAELLMCLILLAEVGSFGRW